MFFDFFLSLFDNKGSYDFFSRKFFLPFFYYHTILVAKNSKKTTPSPSNKPYPTKQKKEAEWPLYNNGMFF